MTFAKDCAAFYAPFAWTSARRPLSPSENSVRNSGATADLDSARLLNCGTTLKSYLDGHVRDPYQTKYPTIAFNLSRGPQGFLKVV